MAFSVGPADKERAERILEELKDGPKQWREIFDREQTGTDSRAIAYLKEQGKLVHRPGVGYVRTDLDEFCPDCGSELPDGHRRCDNVGCASPIVRAWCERCEDTFPIDPVPPNEGTFQCPRCGATETIRLPRTEFLEPNENCNHRGCSGELGVTSGGLTCEDCGRNRRPFERKQEIVSDCPKCERILRIDGDIRCPECRAEFDFKGFTLRVQWQDRGPEHHIDGEMLASRHHPTVEERVQKAVEELGLGPHAEIEIRVGPGMVQKTRL